MTPNLRKPCLKPEYASLYPEVPPNIWLGAAGVAARVAARLRASADSNDRLPKRVLPDEHFEFRGGRPRRQTWRGPGSRLGETSSKTSAMSLGGGHSDHAHGRSREVCKFLCQLSPTSCTFLTFQPCNLHT